jgi:3-hydroxyisobutyrate dehydrogenase
MHVGFIGLGDLGSKLVDDLLDRGVEALDVFDVAPGATDAYRDTATLASSIADVAARAPEIIGICVQNEQQLRDVITGPGGLLDTGLRAGTVLAVHSTVLPGTCRDLAARAAEVGVTLVDAPISQGAQGPEGKPTRLVLIGTSDPELIERYRPYFAGIADIVEHAGDLGAGEVVKLVNNLLMIANLGLASKAFKAGALLGARREVLERLLTTGSGFSQGVRVYLRPDLAAHNVHLLGKDVRLALEVLDGSGWEDEELTASGRLGVAATIELAAEYEAATQS